jgi:homoserine O-succinyltransferase
VLTLSAEAGVDAFLKQRKSLCLFFQGHPEYEAETFLREYRRDVGRFLRGERGVYPEMPSGYFDERATTAFQAFRERAVRERAEALMEAFPAPDVESSLSDAWQRPAARVYRNWLARVAARRRKERILLPAASPAAATQHQAKAAQARDGSGRARRDISAPARQRPGQGGYR